MNKCTIELEDDGSVIITNKKGTQAFSPDIYPLVITAIRQQAAELAERDARITALETRLTSAEWWRGVYPDGATAEQVANELADYKMILENVSLVYDHVTGGRISKGNTSASEVISAADEIMDLAIGEAVHEERQNTERAEAELARLQEFRTLACDENKRLVDEHARLRGQASCGEVVVDIVKGVALGLSNAYERMADEEHALRTRLGWKRFFSIDWWAVHSFRRD